MVAYPRSSSDTASSSQSIVRKGSAGVFALGCRLIGRLRSNRGALPCEQLPLAFHTPPIPAEIPVAADHTVARHEQSELVRGAGWRAGAARFGLPDSRGDLGIARGLAERDFLQSPPHSRLE